MQRTIKKIKGFYSFYLNRLSLKDKIVWLEDETLPRDHKVLLRRAIRVDARRYIMNLKAAVAAGMKFNLNVAEHLNEMNEFRHI